VNTHRFELSIRNAVGYAALAAAALLTIVFVVSSVAHSKAAEVRNVDSKAEVHSACAKVGGRPWVMSGRFAGVDCIKE
jgi:hypothetical protein